MKKFTFFLFPLFGVISASAQSMTVQDSIKNILENETLAFANADLAAWSDYFVHEPYLRWSVSGTMYFDGWDALYQGAKSFLESQAGRSGADALHQITRSDWDIHINGDMAWVKYVQVTAGTPPITAQQFRVLERVNGEWKISMLVAVR